MATKHNRLILPKLHKAQQRMFNEKKLYNVGCCGRRFGKTLFAQILLCQDGGVLHGQPCAWFAPKAKYMAKVWREVCETLAPIIVRKNATERIIEFVGGGELEFWTLEDIDAGKSRKYARVIIDEAELAKDLKYSWEQAISPTLLDLNGDAWFFSTPKGFTYFQELFERGQSDHEDDTDWMSWQIPTSGNPTLRGVAEYLRKQKKALPDLVFRQEYLAEFVDFGGTLIEREWIRYGTPNPRDVYSTAIGVDLAISIKEDACFTAFVVCQNTIDGKIWVRDCLKERLKFHEIVEKLTEFGEKWDPDIINIEQVQFQAAVVQEMLRKTKLNIKGCIPEKNNDKLIRFLPLQPRYRNGIIHHDPELPRYFERDVLGFPSSVDKDIPDAYVYAFRGLRVANQGAISTGARESSRQINSQVSPTSGGWGTVSEE